MLLYYIFPFFLLYIIPNIKTKVVAGKNRNLKRDNSEKFFWIFLIFSISFIWMYGLRDMGGADDAAYRLYYERNYGGGVFDFLNTDKEPLFNLLKAIGYTFGLNYKTLFIGYAAIDLCFLISALKNYYRTKSHLTLYLAAFFFIAFSGVFTTMRQSAATAILFYLYSLENPSRKKRIVLWALIILSHYGFLILLPFEIVFSEKQYRISKTTKVIVPCVCLVMGGFINLSGIIQKITSVLGLYNYMNGSGNYTGNSNLGIVTVIMFLIYLYLLLVNGRLSGVTGEDFNAVNKISYGNMMYFSIMFLTSRLKWGNRLGCYYLFTVPMLIPFLYDALPVKKKGKLLKYSIITVLYFGFIMVMKGILGENGYIWSLNFRR